MGRWICKYQCFDITFESGNLLVAPLTQSFTGGECMERKNMSTLFQPTALVGAIAIAMGFSVSAQANTDSSVNASLETLVVTASRSEEKIKDVPARINVIDQKTIGGNPTLNLSDLIQKDASIYIKQSGGIGQVPEISLRGTYQPHTLVLKDGARLNNQNHYSPLFSGFIDTNDAQQIEILKGPASVQYGSDAIGGVIQLISKKPEKSGAELTGIYGENNTYKTIVNANLVTDQGFYAQVGGQRLESDGTPIFESQSKNKKAGYDQKGYNAKLGYTQKDLIDTSVSISENKGTNLFHYLSLNNDSPRQFENRVINAKVAYNILPNLVLNTQYANVQDKQDVRDYGSYYNTENNQGDLNLKWKFTPNQNILVGATYNDANFKSNTILNSNQSVDSTGYYVQHQFKNEKFNTQVGVRLEDNERFGNHTVGQGAIRYFIQPTTSVYANVGTAFRAPALTELYYYSEESDQYGIYHTYGNTNLKPEESISYEIGLDHQFTSALALYLSAYKTDIKNLITSFPSYDSATNISTTTYENINKAQFTGGEVGLKWKQNDLFLSTEYAYVKTENKETGLEIAYRPKNTVTLTTGLENAIYGVSVSAIARSNSNASNSENSVKVPGYATVDFNAFWNINPNVKLFTNIQNVGDVKYREVLNTYPSKDWYINGGRLASAGVTFRY